MMSDEAVSMVSLTSSSGGYINGRNSANRARKVSWKHHCSCYPCMKGAEIFRTFCVQDDVHFGTFRCLDQ